MSFQGLLCIAPIQSGFRIIYELKTMPRTIVCRTMNGHNHRQTNEDRVGPCGSKTSYKNVERRTLALPVLFKSFEFYGNVFLGGLKNVKYCT